MNRLRVAFVTDEYPTTLRSAGGLATYVARIARLLTSRGYEVHVFLPGLTDSTCDDQGIAVHQVCNDSSTFTALANWAAKSWKLRSADIDWVLREIGTSYAVSKAVSKYEAEQGPFAWIQSADFQFRGLFIKRRHRPLFVRCSWARDLFNTVDGVSHLPRNRWAAALERLAIKRADAAYAPSRIVSGHFKRAHGINIHVIRPPIAAREDRASENSLVPNLPDRYFLHFGQMTRRKGTDYVIHAAKELEGAGVKIVFAGMDYERMFEGAQLPSNVIFLGPVTRDVMEAVLKRALASVLPSRIDNLPNTAIESLSHGIPVITLEGTGVDELITHGANGWIFDQKHPDELAGLMLDLWHGKHHLTCQGRLDQHPIFEEMDPYTAVDLLITFIKNIPTKRRLFFIRY